MDNIEKYLKFYSKRLHDSFEDIRGRNKDSDVKGGKNEKIVADFLRYNTPAEIIPTGVEIIDSFGKASAEIDICVCNSDQPFIPESDGPVIAEGVDYVVQVKAILSNNEIDRIIKNAQSVKRLVRVGNIGDSVYAFEGRIKHHVERIPYLVFTFDSELSFETTDKSIREKMTLIPPEEQPDAIFILNKACHINYHNFESGWISKGKIINGWVSMQTKEATLLEFLRFIYTFVPRHKRVANPIIKYFPLKFMGDKIIHK